MENKIIYPNYELGHDGYRAGAITHIRKQDDNNIWNLIPVVMRYEFDRKLSTENQLLDFIKRFHEQCYKFKLFYKFNDNLVYPEKPWIKLYSKDENQKSEEDRLSIKLKKKISNNIKTI